MAKLPFFVARFNLHLDKRVRARVNLCVRDEDKESRASDFFVTWWAVQFQSFKKPLNEERQTDRNRATDREGERKREWANPRHHDAQVSASPAVMLH
ncbi:hypothetical protein QQF64_012648 [Cirrhinus molitorella]|uniref:Uncharacterized protein n=1 Tax=Cirrhinus molitorella TaxID=172907 RepID=A0ABR3M061_9TELE